jgi:GDPmannose 4,6-dehydratase
MNILILGANGQDGRLLCDFFDEKNVFYDIVVRVKARHKNTNITNVFIGDLNNIDFVKDIFSKHTYDRVFNFANETFVRDGNLVHAALDKTKIFFNLTAVIEENNLNFWLCQPLSSEIFGTPSGVPQNSNTEISPINNYGLAKTIEFYGSRILRSKGFKVFNPIFFNHESSYRDIRFFSAKAIRHFIDYKNHNNVDVFKFHNALSVRDWGYAKEFVELIVRSSQLEIDGLSVVGTGHQMSVLDFLKYVFVNLKIEVEFKTNHNNLMQIKDIASNKIIAEEMGVNKVDIGRKFKADTSEMVKLGLDKPKIYGKELIDILIHDIQK